jgi:hypothetical protein
MCSCVYVFMCLCVHVFMCLCVHVFMYLGLPRSVNFRSETEKIFYFRGVRFLVGRVCGVYFRSKALRAQSDREAPNLYSFQLTTHHSPLTTHHFSSPPSANHIHVHIGLILHTYTLAHFHTRLQRGKPSKLNLHVPPHPHRLIG